MLTYYKIEDHKNPENASYTWEVGTIFTCDDSLCGEIITPGGRLAELGPILLQAWCYLYKLKTLTKEEYNYLKGLYLL